MSSMIAWMWERDLHQWLDFGMTPTVRCSTWYRFVRPVWFDHSGLVSSMIVILTFECCFLLFAATFPKDVRSSLHRRLHQILALMVVFNIAIESFARTGSTVSNTAYYEAHNRSVVSSMIQRLEIFKADLGRYPLQSEGLAALDFRPEALSDWNGPYVTADDVQQIRFVKLKYLASESAVKLIAAGADTCFETGDDIVWEGQQRTFGP
jgi:hypothetical protein